MYSDEFRYFESNSDELFILFINYLLLLASIILKAYHDNPISYLFIWPVGNYWEWTWMEHWHRRLATYLIWTYCKTVAALMFRMQSCLHMNSFQFCSCWIAILLKNIVDLIHLNISIWIFASCNSLQLPSSSYICFYLYSWKGLYVEQHKWDYTERNWQYQKVDTLVSWGIPLGQ